MVAGVVMPKPGEGKHKIEKLTNSVTEELFETTTKTTKQCHRLPIVETTVPTK